jgi:hypothetical protein
MEPSETSSPASSGAVMRYISAVGAALIATFFDFVRNGELSAVTKTAVSIKEQLQLTGSTSSASIAAILIFGAIGAILVCAYQPKETKESFLLGLSVLVVAGLSVPPATPRADSGNRREAGGAMMPSLLPMSSAYADEPAKAGGERRIWILLDGPGQREIPEVRVMVYSGSSGQLLFNNLMFTKFSLVVPAGTHQVELSRNGFRSVSFKINPSQENATYKVALNRVDFFSAKNFLGPQSVTTPEDAELTRLIADSVNQCQLKNAEAAAKSAQQAGMVRDKLDRDTRRLLCL